jgi:alkylation response protein AidB-like acyl-CoA dehydrogenase
MAIGSQDRSDKAKAVLANVRGLGPTLRERALDAERAGRHSDQTIADLDATGAFKIGSPAEYGGDELSVREQLDVISEVSKWDGSAGWTVWVGASTNWLPAGMGPRVISGGPWTFGSDSLWAPFTNLGCIASDMDGPHLIGLQVPIEQLRFVDDWKVAGMRATGSVSMTLADDELFVPDYRGVDFRDVLSGVLDSGLKGPLWKAPTLGWAFTLMAGMSIGIAQGALERFIERSDGRPIRGTTYKNQLEAPLTHLMLADVHSKIQSATLMARANADETDRLGALAANGGPADPDYLQNFSARALVETAFAAKWCAEAVELLQRNSGSTAIMDSEPIQRAWRDARVISLHGALNLEALSENYGRLMAGVKPHEVAGITALDRFAPMPVKSVS